MQIKINQKSKSKKLLIAACVVGIIGAAAYWSLQKDDKNKITYSESIAEVGTLHVKILATGTVQPENRLEIKPPIAGRIEQVLIKEGDEVKKGQILAWMSSTERAALIDAARSKGAEEIKKWEDIYPPTPILAPLSGTIVLKNVEQGETFTSTDSLMSMSDRLTVKAQVDETDIASIKVKQQAEIVLDAYPDQKIGAEVDKIAFDATTVNNVTTYVVDVLPKEIPQFMRSGMTANVTFKVTSKENVLLISSDALRTKEGKSTVLVRQNGEEIEKEVVTGLTNGKQIEIISGLTVGEIVLSPQIKLEKNSKGSSPFNPMGGRKVGKR